MRYWNSTSSSREFPSLFLQWKVPATVTPARGSRLNTGRAERSGLRTTVQLDRFFEQEHHLLPMCLFARWTSRETFFSFLDRFFLYSHSGRAPHFRRLTLSAYQRVASKPSPSFLADRLSPAQLDHIPNVHIIGCTLAGVSAGTISPLRLKKVSNQRTKARAYTRLWSILVEK
jgi:hypothetical protein